MIEAHNAKNLSWTVGVNKFSDWSKEEYRRILNWPKNHGSDGNCTIVKPDTRSDFTEEEDEEYEFINPKKYCQNFTYFGNGSIVTSVKD